MLAIVLGSFLVICGLLLLLRKALGRRRLSEPPQAGSVRGKPSLEPQRQGLRFFSLGRNWPGLALMAAGAILLIFGAST